jgi:hypothetical protein
MLALKMEPTAAETLEASDALCSGSDNYGSKFGPEYQEGVTQFRRSITSGDFGHDVRAYLQRTRDRGNIPLSATGLEPHPDNFFRTGSSMRAAVALRLALRAAVLKKVIAAAATDAPL